MKSKIGSLFVAYLVLALTAVYIAVTPEASWN